MRRLICKACAVLAQTRGASAVEFAVLAPVVVLFLMGTIETGRAGLVYFSLLNATQEAAHAGMVGTASGGSPQTETTLTALVRAAARGVDPATITVVVAYGAGGNVVNSTVRVTSTTSFTPMMLNLFGVGALPLSASTEMPIVN